MKGFCLCLKLKNLHSGYNYWLNPGPSPSPNILWPRGFKDLNIYNTHMKPGYLVKTKTGKTGRTYHAEKMVNGKLKVHVMEDYNLTGEKLLCDPKKLKIIGFID